jgi:hypothetical protein
MSDSSPNFYHGDHYILRMHYILHRFLIWPTFQGHIGQTSIIFTMCSNSLTIGRIYTKFLSCIHLIRIHHILPGFYIWPTFQGHRGQTLKFCDLLQHLNYVADLHQIFIMGTSNKDISHIARVLISPTFQGHRGQTLTFLRSAPIP